MFEMEAAAERIVELAMDGPTFSINDMESDIQRDGLVELILRGWVEDGLNSEGHHYNGTLQAKAIFWERIHQRKGT